jgi:hypothetical protein
VKNDTLESIVRYVAGKGVDDLARVIAKSGLEAPIRIVSGISNECLEQMIGDPRGFQVTLTFERVDSPEFK